MFVSDYKRLLHEAKLALKKSQRKDYYKILGVDRNANDEEIKKAYKKRALVHHPGMHFKMYVYPKNVETNKNVCKQIGIRVPPKRRKRNKKRSLRN